MRRKIILSVAIVFLSGFALMSLFRGNSPYYDKYENYKYGFIPYYSTIENKCSDDDRVMAESVINLARKIMTDMTGDIPPNADKLETYSLKYSLTKKEIARIKADINLITADFTFGNGYIWVEYSKTSYDESNGIIDEGTYLAYWKLKNENGTWRVTRIKEAKVNNQFESQEKA